MYSGYGHCSVQLKCLQTKGFPKIRTCLVILCLSVDIPASEGRMSFRWMILLNLFSLEVFGVVCWQIKKKKINLKILKVLAALFYKINPRDLGSFLRSSHSEKIIGIVDPVFTRTVIALGCLKMKSHKGVEIKLTAKNSVTDLLHDFEEGILTCLCQPSHL